MRRRSRKRERLYATVRRPLVARLLAGDPPCQRCLSATATDVHELRSRARGGSITDEANLAILCRACHDLVTREPLLAAEEGWSLPSWDE